MVSGGSGLTSLMSLLLPGAVMMLSNLSSWISSEVVVHCVFYYFLVTCLQTLNFGNGFALALCLSFLPNTDGEYPVKYILKEQYICILSYD